MKLAVLASGRGSNFKALLDNMQAGKLPVTLEVLISDQPEAMALETARAAGIDTAVFARKGFPDNEAFNAAIRDELDRREIELVVLAGYMRIVRDPFMSDYAGRIINIHPALLPAFPGLDVQRKAIDYGVRFSGCTVHYVDAGVDTGPIILQAVVPVEQDDDEHALAARILREEHKIFSEAIRLIAEGRITIEGRKVRIAQ